MVMLRNFEYIAGTLIPIPGAVVRIYEAILTGTYGPALTFTDHNGNSNDSTTTNPDGMWAAIDLPDGFFYDVVVEYNDQFKQYKGRTMHLVERLADDRDPVENRNLIPNGNHDSWSRWIRNGSVTISGIGTTDVEVADYWWAACTSGDSTSGTRVSSSGVSSLYASQLSYNRVSGQMQYRFKDDNTRKGRALRGRTVSVTIAIQQDVNCRLRAFIYDGIGTTNGAVQTTVGSWIILSATRSIDSAATTLEVGVSSDAVNPGSYVILVTNCILDFGSDAPVYTLSPTDAGMTEAEIDRFIGAASINDAATVLPGNLGYLSEIIDSYATRIKGIIGAAGGTWRSTIPRTLTQLLSDVTTALNNAQTGITNAATAQSTANAATSAASAAQTTANTGVANAAAAQGTATTAQSAANTAQGTANTALANAATAQGTANTALANAASALAVADTKLPLSGGTVTGTIGISGSGNVQVNTTASFGFDTNQGIRAVQLIQGGSLAITGAKSAAVKDKDGYYRAFHSLETPEPWFEDVGRGKIRRGVAVVKIPPDFAQFVQLAHGPYYVFITPEDPANLYVADRTSTSFTVRQLHGVDAGFVWRIMVRRADISPERLALIPFIEVPPDTGV